VVVAGGRDAFCTIRHCPVGRTSHAARPRVQRDQPPDDRTTVGLLAIDAPRHSVSSGPTMHPTPDQRSWTATIRAGCVRDGRRFTFRLHLGAGHAGHHTSASSRPCLKLDRHAGGRACPLDGDRYGIRASANGDRDTMPEQGAGTPLIGMSMVGGRLAPGSVRGSPPCRRYRPPLTASRPC